MSGSLALPEWAVVLVLSGIGVVMWWGVRRLVEANDHTNVALIEIGNALSSVNARLGRSETWQDMHQKSDDRQFDGVHARIDALVA